MAAPDEMCGILGYFGFGRASVDAARYAAQVSALAHRGPDDAACWRHGSFFFGHRRLSIIDLSQGRQPMWRAQRDLAVTFNGEIYNYVELRDELSKKGYAFRTHSDTEVLLHGYREWGTDLPRRLVGMFAFGIADLTKGELFLARDPFGEKPLLYTTMDDGVVFASELSPISALLGARRALNASALPGYLCLNYVTGDDTLMEGVIARPRFPATCA